MIPKALKKVSFLTLLYIAILTLLIAFLFFNKYGLVKYISLRQELTEIERQIDQSRIELEKLDKEIDSLKNSDAKLEKVAREKFLMKAKNEKAIIIKKKIEQN